MGKENLNSITNDEKLNDKQNYIQCKLCGLPVKAIASHLIKKDGLHDGWNLARYKKEFIDEPIIAPNTSKILSEQNMGENNSMHKSKTTDLYRKGNSPFSKEFYIKRGFNELEAIEKLKEFTKIAIKDRISSVSLEYHLKKCNGNLEEAKKLHKERQATFTLDKCIKKYGNLEGVKVYKNRQEKWVDKMNKNFIKEGDGRNCGSTVANEFFDKIYYLTNSIKPLKEKFIGDKNKKYGNGFSYDFVDLNSKKIIEFNGDYWHCNPEKWSENDFNKTKMLSAKEIWEYDKYKKELAESHGYEVLVIWEYDYYKHPEETLQKSLEFLNKKGI